MAKKRFMRIRKAGRVAARGAGKARKLLGPAKPMAAAAIGGAGAHMLAKYLEPKLPLGGWGYVGTCLAVGILLRKKMPNVSAGAMGVAAVQIAEYVTTSAKLSAGGVKKTPETKGILEEQFYPELPEETGSYVEDESDMGEEEEEEDTGAIIEDTGAVIDY